MKIVLWIGDGANQRALANKIHSLYNIDLIIIESKQTKKKLTISKIIEKIADKLFYNAIHDAWVNTMNHYDNYGSYPNTKIIHSDNINQDLVYTATNQVKPDLIIVSGTRMIKEKLLSIKPRLGIMNLHTGLSPYIKGGPNCTNWCLANNEFHLIGNTIMWIDKGIDSGNIITTATTQFSGKESLRDIHLKVMEHAHQLCIYAIDEIAKGKISNIPQDKIGAGKTYYTKNWNMPQKHRALVNYKKFESVVNSNEYKIAQSALKTVSFPI